MIQIKLLDVALQLLPTALPVLATLPCHSLYHAGWLHRYYCWVQLFRLEINKLSHFY